MTLFRPLLAATVENGDWDKLVYPMIASPKIDGYRCLCHETLGVVTRSLKLLPNEYVRRKLEPFCKYNLDGELVVGDPLNPKSFNHSSAVMARGGEPDFKYLVFDTFDKPLDRYIDRLERLQECMAYYDHESIHLHTRCALVSQQDLEAYEAEKVGEGWEGVMLRSPEGRYKFNRSTFKEQILLKLKRFITIEVEIVGYEPLLRNENEAFMDERGYTKRSSHQENKVEQELLGKFHVRHEVFGMFKVGSGFDLSQREEYWRIKETLRGRKAKIKYQPHGVVDKPRAPIFVGLWTEE